MFFFFSFIFVIIIALGTGEDFPFLTRTIYCPGCCLPLSRFYRAYDVLLKRFLYKDSVVFPLESCIYWRAEFLFRMVHYDKTSWTFFIFHILLLRYVLMSTQGFLCDKIFINLFVNVLWKRLSSQKIILYTLYYTLIILENVSDHRHVNFIFNPRSLI